MSVFVTMSVRPPDPMRFETAAKQAFAAGLPPGCLSQRWGRMESDPGVYLIAGEWESHDAMHVFSEETGDAFNASAGTDGVEWETRVVEILG